MKTIYDPIRGQMSVEIMDSPTVFDPVRGRTLLRIWVVSTNLESRQDSLGQTTDTQNINHLLLISLNLN